MSCDWEHSDTVRDHGSDFGSIRDEKVWYHVDIEKQACFSNLHSSGKRNYAGSGTCDDPFIVEWDIGDPEDPYNWSKNKKWLITMQLALCTWTVSFSSSSYTGGLEYTMHDLHVSENVAVLGISLYVLGFALGPLVFAPMGEMFGRRLVFLSTLSAYTLLQLAGSLGHNLPTLLSCRLLTGIFGSSPLTNAGGSVSDIFDAQERGLANAIYSAVPFLGPVIGPIVGGFVAENPRLGWHFTFWLTFIFSAVSLVFGFYVTPETYAPVLLRERATKLFVESNGSVHYVSKYDLDRSKSFAQVVCTNLMRPFRFMFTEPIVALLAIYVSIVYGTLYALFFAFPVVFQHHRHFSPGQGGLAFLGIGLGIIIGIATTPLQNVIYRKQMKGETDRPIPEARLHMAMMGGILLPVSLFWFAWTSSPSKHWIIPVIAGVPFGIGVSQILQSLTAYLMDAYSIYCASAIAATVVLRSICGALFPVFCPALFAKLGDEWAMSVFAFLSLVCMPIPILFWKYGRWIRSKSKFACKESDSCPVPRSETSSQLGTVQNDVIVEREQGQCQTSRVSSN